MNIPLFLTIFVCYVLLFSLLLLSCLLILSSLQESNHSSSFPQLSLYSPCLLMASRLTKDRFHYFCLFWLFPWLFSDNSSWFGFHCRVYLLHLCLFCLFLALTCFSSGKCSLIPSLPFLLSWHVRVCLCFESLIDWWSLMMTLKVSRWVEFEKEDYCWVSSKILKASSFFIWPPVVLWSQEWFLSFYQNFSYFHSWRSPF